jgi:hypothetical protein
MKSFIRVIEYWVPSADGLLLEFGGGLFGKATRFASITKGLCFGKGEGLPGQVWECGHPIVLKKLTDNYFRRAKAAQEDGLTCGIAMPIYKLDKLTAVMVVFCGDDEAHAGAIELWRNTPKTSKDMTLVDGYYGTTGDTFEFISRSISFRIGNGLPGMAWESQTPVFLEDLGKGSGFLRADSAVRVGINRGFALPCSTLGSANYVMTFLSALATPIAARVEIWQVKSDRSQLTCTYAFDEIGNEGVAAHASRPDKFDQRPVEQAFFTGVPAVAEPMIAIPLGSGGLITSVIALYF